MIIYQKKRRFFLPHLSMGNWKKWDAMHSNADRQGHYYGLVHVRVCQYQRATQDSVTILECVYKGYAYQRNYNSTAYTDRGISMLCAQFIKDVMNNKIK